MHWMSLPLKGFAASESSTAAQMNEYPSTVPRKDGPQLEASTPARNYHRHVMEADAGDPIKCTGKSCKSCTAGLIADCVAICCCPCALVNILAFVFLKVPWTMGKRALKLGKKKLRKKKCGCGGQSQRTCLHLQLQGDGSICRSTNMDISNARNGRVEPEFVFCDEFEAEELKNNLSARLEGDDEDLWLELYQVGHLGFGRVSFTGIPTSLCKGN